MLEIFVRYLHFMGIFGVVSTLVAEHLLIRAELSAAEVRRLARIDAVYGVSALVVVAAGLSLWLWVGKGSAFYAGNPIFRTKVGAFVLVALLSVYPTLFFLRNRKPSQSVVSVPGRVVGLIRAELVILAVIPLLAVLMARGYGLH